MTLGRVGIPRETALRLARSLSLLFVLVCAAGACSLVVDTTGLSGATTDTDASVPDAATDAAADTAAADATADAAADAPVDATADGSPPGCTSSAGPVMTRADTFCIDTTEVTNGQYKQFLLAKNGDTTGQPSYCAWNTTYALKCSEPVPDDNAPVVCVNWCDARAYCAFAGKRLCGRVGGGAGNVGELTNASNDQWYRACSLAGTQTYPYGSTYEPVCNDLGHGTGAPVPVGSLAACVGGYPGLFDMSGNVVEWVDVCTATTGAMDNCYIRGSAFDDDGAGSPCTAASTQLRNSADDTKGFRCCSSP